MLNAECNWMTNNLVQLDPHWIDFSARKHRTFQWRKYNFWELKNGQNNTSQTSEQIENYN